jgi:hypothetical protein
MATIKSEVQTPAVSYTVSLSTLTSGSYVVGATLNHATNDPLDVLIDVQIVSGASTNNKQCVIFCIGSIDGTNFGKSVSDTGLSSADEAEMHFVGTLPLVAGTATHRKIFSLAAAYGGVLPYASKLVFKNDSGATFGTASVQTAEVWGVASA